MRIKQAVFIAVFCLLLGGMLTPIISSSAKSGKGSSCSNPYKTTGANGEQWGDRSVVRTTLKEKALKPFVFERKLTVRPSSGIRVCRVTFKMSNGRKVNVKISPQGGTKMWVINARKSSASVYSVTVLSKRT